MIWHGPSRKAHIAMAAHNRRLTQSEDFKEGFSKEKAFRADQVSCDWSPEQRQRGTNVLDSGAPGEWE